MLAVLDQYSPLYWGYNNISVIELILNRAWYMPQFVLWIYLPVLSNMKQKVE